jgi:chromosome segregation ATPase
MWSMRIAWRKERAQMNTLQKDVELLQGKLEQQELELQVKENEIRQAREQVSSLRRTWKEWDEELENVQSEAEARCGALEATIRQQVDQIGNQQFELEAKGEEIRVLKGQMRQIISQQVDQMEATIRQQVDQIGKQGEEIRILQGQIAEMQAKEQEISQHLADAEAKLKEYEQQKSEAEAGPGTMISLSGENVRLSHEIRDLKDQNKDLQGQLHQLQAAPSPAAAGSLPDQEAKEQELIRLRNMVASLLLDCKGAQMIRQLTTQIHELQSKLRVQENFGDAKLRSRIEYLEAQLEAAEAAKAQKHALARAILPAEFKRYRNADDDGYRF